jgi:hypothetical protein
MKKMKIEWTIWTRLNLIFKSKLKIMKHLSKKPREEGREDGKTRIKSQNRMMEKRWKMIVILKMMMAPSLNARLELSTCLKMKLTT